LFPDARRPPEGRRLTGRVPALFGLNHDIIDEAQYSHLVATVMGSAVVPTVIANTLFMPRHLLHHKEEAEAQVIVHGASDTPVEAD
jgi:glutathione-regulated potassium-efflux system ancillary protein KefC